MPRPRYHYMLSVITTMMVLLLLAGCGKKGPLYHPDGSPAPKQMQSKS